MADLKRRIVAEFSAQNKAKGEMGAFRRDMDSTGQAMKRMASSAIAMAGIGGGIYGIKRVFDYVTKAAMKQEDALFLLEAALRAAGEYTDKTMKGFEAFAASIQKATVYGDEEVLALMQLMKSLGVTSSALKQATKMAIGLAAATGRDVRSMSMYIALAQQGEFTMLRRYIPALRSTTDATEQLRIVTEFAASGFKIAEAKAETASGSIRQMWNAVSDLAEVMGKPFIDTMGKDAETAKDNIEKLTKAIKKNNDAMEGALTTEGGYLKRISTLPEFYEKLWQFITTFEIPKPPSTFEGGGGGRFRGYGTTGGWEEGPEIIRFEEPEWLKATLALNTMTEAQKKAAASMYDMSMKARGLSKELAREKKITQFAALAKVRYGADVAGAEAAQDRFTRALRESEEAKIAAAIASETLAAEEKKRADALEVERIQLELDMKRWDDVARAMEDSFANAFESMAFESEKFGDIVKQVVREVLKEMMRVMMFRPLAQALAGTGEKPGWIQMGLSALGDLITGGGGETIGERREAIAEPGYYGHEGIPAGYFPPRLHRGMKGGLKTDEFLAVIQRGETEIIPRGEAGPPSFTFVMENQTGAPMKMEKQRQGTNPREFIITVVADDAAHGGVLADVFQTRQG